MNEKTIQLIRPDNCQHTDFHSTAHIAREVIDGVAHYRASMSISCKQCASPMSFVGVERGVGIKDRPNTDMLGITLNIPLMPVGNFYEEFVKSMTPPAEPKLVELVPEKPTE